MVKSREKKHQSVQKTHLFLLDFSFFRFYTKNKEAKNGKAT